MHSTAAYEIDFAAEIVRQCRDAGVKEIHDSGVCTACDLEHYYSYRAEKGKTGRMLALLGSSDGGRICRRFWLNGGDLFVSSLKVWDGTGRPSLQRWNIRSLSFCRKLRFSEQIPRLRDSITDKTKKFVAELRPIHLR